MLIKRTVNECDFTQTTYPEPVEGAAVIHQGATGRWCEIMHAGPEYIQQEGWEDQMISAQEAIAKIEQSGNGYPDFDF